MASIQKRVSKDGNISYRVLVRMKGYPVQTATFRRLTDARRWAQETEVAIRDGRHFRTVEAKKHTLNDLVARYAEQYKDQKKSFKDQMRHLKFWQDEIGHSLLADINPALIVECRDKLSKGRKAGTVNRYLSAMSHPFTIAMKEYGWIDDNPFRKVSKLKEPRGRVRYLSDNERKELLKACKQHPNPALYVAVVLAISTGARRGEMISITWDQVDFEHQTIILHDTKNDERRSLALRGHAFDLLKERYQQRDPENPWVFPGPQNPRKPYDMTLPFNRAVKTAGIKDFRWHDLRHTTASYLAMNGASLATIKEALGHKTLDMVNRYAHLAESYTASEVEAMNKKIFGT